ncbi:hypothetical protein D3C84_1124740 [compost metagenome]
MHIEMRAGLEVEVFAIRKCQLEASDFFGGIPAFGDNRPDEGSTIESGVLSSALNDRDQARTDRWPG